MGSNLYHFFGLPLVLFISVPFAAAAALTTSLAFGVLFVRLLIVYIDLGIALIRGAMSSKSNANSSAPVANSSLPARSPVYEQVRARRRRSLASSGTPPHRSYVPKTSSYASLVGPGRDRDYEGVGGWRLSVDDEDEALWLNLNSRLELPAPSSPARRHNRSLTGGSQRASPEMGRSPSLIRLRTPGTASPEGYFSLQPTPSLRDANILGISRVSFDDKSKSTAVSSTDSLASRVGSKVNVRTPGPYSYPV